jgi:two-component system cell cycle sensor histidine kinase/response regulator CckA
VSRRVCFPRVELEGAAVETPAAPVGQARGSEKVLLVEDEDAVRIVAARVLRNQGYTVIPARNGTEALGVVEEHGPSLDLILTDVVMPDMSGLELAGQLRARWPELQLIYMSGYAEGDKLDSRFEVAGGFFLQKPFSAEDLVLRVREVLDARPHRAS